METDLSLEIYDSRFNGFFGYGDDGRIAMLLLLLDITRPPSA